MIRPWPASSAAEMGLINGSSQAGFGELRQRHRVNMFKNPYWVWISHISFFPALVVQKTGGEALKKSGFLLWWMLFAASSHPWNCSLQEGLGRDVQAGFGLMIATFPQCRAGAAHSGDAPGENVSWTSPWQGWDLLFHQQIESLPHWALQEHRQGRGMFCLAFWEGWVQSAELFTCPSLLHLLWSWSFTSHCSADTRIYGGSWRIVPWERKMVCFAWFGLA